MERRQALVRVLARFLCALALLLVCAPAALAQSDSWRELRTTRFAILYTDSDAETAREYAGFVDGIYDEVTAIFGHSTDTPVTLRLYPTLERYYEINPLARSVTGIVAHADYRRHEVVVIIPQTTSQTPDEVQNNVRHELTHIVASDLSEDRLTVMFQEGLAQYVEHPSRELEVKIRLLKDALDQGRLVRWSDLDDRERFYQNAQISYPQSMSIVAFLVERYSFAKLREFVTASARSNGYRTALNRAYGVSPDTLEEEWRAWLPSYLAGGYRRNALNAYDLSQAQQLLQQGRYGDAQQDLERAIEWLRTTDQAEVLQEAEQMLERSIAGQQAESLAAQARAALEQGRYADAADLTGRAQQGYAALGDQRQNEVLNEYATRAQRGQQAETVLQQAAALADSLRFPQARAMADQALDSFRALGDSDRAAQALSLRSTMDQRQTLLGGVLLALGALGIAASAWRRLTVQEAEAW
ncbi:MAG: peptidase MA family metallohydrolase [Roseiflexaceae bacterium]